MRKIIVPTLAAFVAATGVAGAARMDGDGSRPEREQGARVTAGAASTDGRGKGLTDFTVRSTLDVRTCCGLVDADRDGKTSLGDYFAGSFEVRRRQVHRAHFTQHVTEMETERTEGDPPDAPLHPRTTMGQTMYAFRDGTVAVQFVQDERQAARQGETLRGAITGGTGAYTGASGEVRTRYVSTPEEEEQTGLQVADERFDFVDGR